MTKIFSCIPRWAIATILCATTLSACSPRNATADPARETTDDQASAQSANLPPSKAEALREAQNPDDAMPSSPQNTVTQTAVQGAENLYGEWILDTDKAYERLSDVEREHVGSMIKNTALSMTFLADGTLITHGASMGVIEERRGHFQVLDVDEQTLLLELKEDDLVDDEGKVLQRGTPLRMRAEFVSDHALEWAPEKPRQGQSNPYQTDTMYLTRDPAKLRAYENALERAIESSGPELQVVP